MNPCLQFSKRHLINPELKIFGQELDLVKQAKMCFKSPVSIVAKSFVHHYKSITVAASGYKVGLWKREFDYVSTYHAPNARGNHHTRMVQLQKSNIVFVLQSDGVSNADATVELRVRELGRSLRALYVAEVHIWKNYSVSYDLANVDVLIVLDEAYELTKIQHVKTSLIKVAWIHDNSEVTWQGRRDLGHFNMIISSSQSLKKKLDALTLFHECFIRCPKHVQSVVRREAAPVCIHDFARNEANNARVDKELSSCLSQVIRTGPLSSRYKALDVRLSI